MLTLAFETSAKAASVALCESGRLICQSLQCSGLTHSRTLLPMAEDLLKNSEYSWEQIDCFAVAHGPGSFTGLRIGMAEAKGLCWALEKPAVGVSTLEAMAWNGLAFGEGANMGCSCIVHRKDRNHPIGSTVFLREYSQNNAMWNTKPHVMLEKVAIEIGRASCRERV